MSESKSWINDEPKWSAIPWMIVKAIFVIFIVLIIGGIISSIVSIDIPDSSEVIVELEKSGYEGIYFFLLLLVLALIEELLFRFIPITIGMNGFKSMKLTIFFCIISSVIFGYLHGNFANLLAQGLIGIVFCIIYLKFGASNGKIIKPLFLTTFTHALFNLAAISLIRIPTS